MRNTSLSTPIIKKDIRTIRLLQDDGQIRIVSKVYELKHLKATDVRPFVEAAVKRYSRSSNVERVNYPHAKRQMLIVSTGEDFIPYVDDLIAGLDKPGKPGKSGSLIEGTGITRITYIPNYRAAEDIVRLINAGTVASSEGRAFLNQDTNTIYWKDVISTTKVSISSHTKASIGDVKSTYKGIRHGDRGF